MPSLRYAHDWMSCSGRDKPPLLCFIFLFFAKVGIKSLGDSVFGLDLDVY